MSQWLEQIIDHANAQPGPDWLAQWRKAAITKLTHQPWPTRKTEAWRFTSLTPVEVRSMNAAKEDEYTFDLPVIEGLDSIDIVFASGKLVTDISSLDLPEGLNICSLQNEDASVIAASRLSTIKPDSHLFGLVNDTMANAGVVIDVQAGASVTKPIRLVHITANESDNHSRIFVRINENASATVIEHGVGADDSMNTSFAEYEIASNGSLEHYRFALFTQSALHAGGSHFRLAESAYMNSTLVGFGSAMSRLNIDVDYQGEHAKADINAMYLLAEGENFDLQTTIEHAVPHCVTDEKVRGIVGDRAKANFNGRIHIHRHAQKTLAELNNRNLLLSRRGQINTKPELEIYADDVKCAHGATVAEIEENALYYLLSRGISRSQALIMLNFGFIQELINDINQPAIRDWLTDMLRARFARMEVK